MKKTIVAGCRLVLLFAAAFAVKMIFFPSVSDKFFLINPQRLRQVPPGLRHRPSDAFSQFAKKSSPPGMMRTNVKGAQWMVGRNITFQQLIAVAYAYNPGRIALPPDAPKGNFDYLVTVSKDTRSTPAIGHPPEDGLHRAGGNARYAGARAQS